MSDRFGGECPVCGRNVATTTGRKLYSHQNERTGARCAGSWRHVETEKPAKKTIRPGRRKDAVKSRVKIETGGAPKADAGTANILDTGADPGGTNDSTEALRVAIDRYVKGEASRVLAPVGVYRLSGLLAGELPTPPEPVDADTPRDEPSAR